MEELICMCIGVTSLGVIKACYAYGTKFTKQITIDDKFERVSGNNTGVRQIFTVSTTNDEIFKVTQSLWYWKYYPTETWNSLKKGRTYTVTGYGWRNGFLSLYPNIIEAKEIE